MLLKIFSNIAENIILLIFTKQTPILNLKEASIILIDKPLTWTSFDVVKKLKYAISHKLSLKQRRFKIGHAGTLDPLASGLLILCTGKATKQIQEIQDAPKVYTGSLMLGGITPSYDLETDIIETFPTEQITKENCEATAKSFIGEINQVPPIYSAIWVNGKRAYDLARKGEDVELKSRKITITEFNVETSNLPLVKFKIACSKGTYIRSLAYDFGVKMNNGAYLKSLCRTQIGDYNLNDAWSVEEFVEFIKNYEVDGSI